MTQLYVNVFPVVAGLDSPDYLMNIMFGLTLQRIPWMFVKMEGILLQKMDLRDG